MQLKALHPSLQTLRQPLLSLFETFLQPCIGFVRKQCSEVVATVDNNLAQSLMRLLGSLFASYKSADSEVTRAAKRLCVQTSVL